MDYYRGETVRLVARVVPPEGRVDAGVELRLGVSDGAPPLPLDDLGGGLFGVYLSPATVPPAPPGRYGASIWAVWPNGAQRLAGFAINIK